MQIKEIIKIAAIMLDRKEIVDYLDGKTQNASQEVLDKVNTMIELTNLVINELACSFVPMVKIKSLNSNGRKIYYSTLGDKLIKIRAVYSNDDSPISFKVKPEYVEVNEEKVKVEYEYVPPKYLLEEKIGYEEKDISSRVLAYGLLAELGIVEGRFEEATASHDRYVEGVRAVRLPKNNTIKKRGWV